MTLGQHWQRTQKRDSPNQQRKPLFSPGGGDAPIYATNQTKVLSMHTIDLKRPCFDATLTKSKQI
jgi:hypothetical protein